MSRSVDEIKTTHRLGRSSSDDRLKGVKFRVSENFDPARVL